MILLYVVICLKIIISKISLISMGRVQNEFLTVEIIGGIVPYPYSV